VTGRAARYARSQNGYTLIEVVIASAVGAIVVGGLTSVVLTTMRAATIATSRVEASAQIRSFQSFADGDFARSLIPTLNGCGTTANPCTTQPIVLNGWQVSNATSPVSSSSHVSYAWDGVQFVNRQVGATSLHAATNVSAYTWYVDTSGTHPTVVVSMTVTVGSYSQSQVLRFLPQVMQ
jgi:prepilin-type N-terminal cleavage/methylation domain-containing protein